MNLPFLLLVPAMAFIKEDCFEPRDEGTCRQFSPRFYYNFVTDSCEKFDYGGCEGNNNNFLTEKACQQACTEVYPMKTKECSAPLLRGSCGASIPRYYYNYISEKCEEFIYEGCGGNLNNFLSLHSCESKCIKPTPEELNRNMCDSKPDPGPCMAEIKRFFYSPLSDNCHSFTYGGCGGNANNHHDMDTCLRACSEKKDAFVE